MIFIQSYIKEFITNMAGPIQNSLSNVVNSVAAVAAVGKHLKEEEKQTEIKQSEAKAQAEKVAKAEKAAKVEESMRDLENRAVAGKKMDSEMNKIRNDEFKHQRGLKKNAKLSDSKVRAMAFAKANMRIKGIYESPARQVEYGYANNLQNPTTGQPYTFLEYRKAMVDIANENSLSKSISNKLSGIGISLGQKKGSK